MLVAGKGRKPEMLLSLPTISFTVSRLDPERRSRRDAEELGVISTMEDGLGSGRLADGRRAATLLLARVGCDKNISHLMRAWFFVKLGENETRGI